MSDHSMGSQEPDVVVTQVDRDAAAHYMAAVRSRRWSVKGILSGGCDNVTIVQSFARHRTAAERAQIERDAVIVESCSIVVGGTLVSLARIAKAIRGQ